MITMLLTSLASSMDGLACGFLIGMKRIKLSVKNLLLISLFPFFISFLSMSLAQYLMNYMNEDSSRFISVSLYFILALYSFVISLQNKRNDAWIDPNQDLQISGFEIVSVGLALSMDSIVTSLPLAFLGYPILGSSFLFGVFNAGMVALGNQISHLIPMSVAKVFQNITWIVFLCLAIVRLF